MPNFLEDYLFYQSGNESHPIHNTWSALCVLSTIIGRRVYFLPSSKGETYAQLCYIPNLYICLVGPQGDRKSFSKDEARDFLADEFPEYSLCASVETREGICQFLGSDDALRVYRDENGASVEWRPYLLAINELTNFISVDPAKMIGFLVDIYDRKYYDVKTKNKGVDRIPNPYIGILACATTEYIIDQLRDKILSGGLARRMVFVNPGIEVTRRADPTVPIGGKDAKARLIAHLKDIQKLAGPIEWENESVSNFYKLWYETLKLSNDPLMAGFERSMHVQIIKVAMLLSVGSYPPTMRITKQIFQEAKRIIEALKPGLERLFLSAGRSEVAIPQMRIVEYLKHRGGLCPEKVLLKDTTKEFRDPAQQWQTMRFMCDNDILIKQVVTIPPDKAQRVWIFLPDVWKTWGKNGEIEVTNNQNKP